MLSKIFLYIGALLPMIWGIAHLFPTKNVVKGFGHISEDNRRIITMEWIIEGVALIYIGLVVVAAAAIDYSHSVSRSVFWLTFITLNSLAIISIKTGAKIDFLPFKICPILFGTSSILILIGAYI